MGFWGPMQRQLLNYVARHPQLRKMAQSTAQKMAKSPQLKNAQQRAQAYYEKAVKDAAAAGAAAGKGRQQQQQQQQQHNANGKEGPQFSFFNKLTRKAILGWHQHKGRVFAFVAANFFMIIMVMQFFPVVCNGVVQAVRALTSRSEERRQLRHQEQQQRLPTESHEGEDETQQLSKKQRKKCKNKRAEEGLEDEEAADMHRHRYMSEEEKAAAAAAAPPAQPSSPFNRLTQKLGSDCEDSAKPAQQLAANPFAFSTASSSSPSACSSSSTMFDDSASSSSWGNGKANVQDRFNEMHQGVFKDNNDLHGMKIDFNSSFLVKMGDETEFTSSLEREHLTGEKPTH